MVDKTVKRALYKTIFYKKIAIVLTKSLLRNNYPKQTKLYQSSHFIQ